MPDYGDFKGASGVLNKNAKKKSAKSPDYLGRLTVDEEVVRYLIEQIKGGNKSPNLNFSAWLMESKHGKFISIKASKYNGPEKPGTTAAEDDF